MKSKNLIPIIILLGIAILFFFPSPEENFLIYLGVILFFIAVIVFLVKKLKK